MLPDITKDRQHLADEHYQCYQARANVVHQNIGISDIILGHFQTLAKMSQQNLHLSARVLYEGKVTESLVKFAAGKLMSQLVHNFKSFYTGTAL